MNGSDWIRFNSMPILLQEGSIIIMTLRSCGGSSASSRLSDTKSSFGKNHFMAVRMFILAFLKIAVAIPTSQSSNY
ncbi:MAG: hypothetical protein WCW35_12495 [Bacteroidota bacterium]